MEVVIPLFIILAIVIWLIACGLDTNRVKAHIESRGGDSWKSTGPLSARGGSARRAIAFTKSVMWTGMAMSTWLIARRACGPGSTSQKTGS